MVEVVYTLLVLQRLASDWIWCLASQHWQLCILHMGWPVTWGYPVTMPYALASIIECAITYGLASSRRTSSYPFYMNWPTLRMAHYQCTGQHRWPFAQARALNILPPFYMHRPTSGWPYIYELASINVGSISHTLASILDASTTHELAISLLPFHMDWPASGMAPQHMDRPYPLAIPYGLASITTICCRISKQPYKQISFLGMDILRQ